MGLAELVLLAVGLSRAASAMRVAGLQIQIGRVTKMLSKVCVVRKECELFI